jgi:hypothetical protein
MNNYVLAFFRRDSQHDFPLERVLLVSASSFQRVAVSKTPATALGSINQLLVCELEPAMVTLQPFSIRVAVSVSHVVHQTSRRASPKTSTCSKPVSWN